MDKTNRKQNRTSALVLALLAALLALGPATVLADDDDHIEARELLRRGEIVPLSKILAVVQERVPGDVIEVELDREDEGWEYEVKVLTQAGRVRKLYLDAATATVTRIKDD